MEQDMVCKYLTKWKQSITNGNKNIIYIDVPFCLNICKFCIFHSVQLTSSEQLRNHVKKNLQTGLALCRDAFGDIVADVIFWGGGTPSLLNREQIEEICLSIPNFKKIKIKAFEAHPETLELEKLDALLNLGFNYFTLGIQSFDQDVLAAVGRKYVSPNKMCAIVDRIHAAGGIVSVDLIAFLRKWNLHELEYTEADIHVLIEKVKPDIIVVHTDYKKIKSGTAEIRGLNKLIQKICLTSEYYVSNADIFELSSDNLEQMAGYAYNLYQGNFQNICNMKQYDCSGPGNLNSEQNVFGIGGIPERKIYSYIGNEIQWYTHFDGEKYIVEQVPYNFYMYPPKMSKNYEA